jgi:thiamine-phosphate pyrophosphorylase
LILYYITDMRQLGGREPLLEKISEAARAGVDYIQLREREMTARELERLATDALRRVRESGSRTKLLINSRVDVALAVGADGVHLRSNDIAANEARAIWAKSVGRTDCVIGVSCHSLADVLSAESHGADFVVFGPVFGKIGTSEPPVGVEALREATSKSEMPVIALGGVTLENARECVEAGAAGVAAIRMFQDGDVAAVVRRLR